MASFCFLVGQPRSGSCCTLTPGRELAAASLISRGQQLPFPMVLVWAGLSRGIPGQQDKAWALLCFLGGSGVTEGEAELWLKDKIQRFSSREKEKVCGISSCALLSYLRASHKVCFSDWLLLTMIIGKPSPESYSWIFQKTKLQQHLMFGQMWVNIEFAHTCQTLHTVQLMGILHIPISSQFYNPKDPKLDWNFWMASGLGDLRLQIPWNKYLEVKI